MEGFRVSGPTGGGPALLFVLALVLAVPLARVNAASLGTETTVGRDVLTQTLAYDGHQSLATHPIRNGIVTWNLAATLAKSGAADQSSSTYGVGVGIGWRNERADFGGGFTYSSNSTTQATSLGPNLTAAYRFEFSGPRRRAKQVKIQKPQPRGSRSQTPPPEDEPPSMLEVPVEPVVVGSGFKPSLTVRGGIRYDKTSQSSSGSSLPFPIPSSGTSSSQDLSQLALSAMLLFSPGPVLAIGGGVTKFSYSQSSSSSSPLAGLESYLGSYGSLAGLASLSQLGSLGSISTGGASSLPLFGSAYTFGALASTSLDLILMLFPAALVDVEMRGNLTKLTDGAGSVKDLRAALYFHLTEAWTLGAGANHAFSDGGKQTFVSASLSYAFY